MRLGELLVQENLVSAEGIQEALEAQVVHGGRLGTNLVELGLLQETDLARMLGKHHNVPHASGEMTPDPRALQFLDGEFCDEKDVVPMRADQTRISVACINPGDLETIDQIGFKTGKRVTVVVIPEFRMHQLLRRHFKAFRTMRSIDMNAVRKSRTQQQQQAKKGDDLMSEEEFQSLYAQALAGGAEAREDVLEGAVVEEAAPPPPQPRPPLAVPAARPPIVINPAQPPPALTPSAPPVPTAPPVAHPVAQPSAQRVQEPVPVPVTFAEAQQLLSKSSDREDIARTVLRFAISKWRRSLILSVQGQLVTGWHGAGSGIREKAVQRIGIALRGQSTFKLVCDTRSHYVGPMKRDAGTAVFYKLLGGGFPQTAVILPLLVRGKVVHLLYVDNGPDRLTPPDIGELLILGQSVSRSYETLLRKRLKSA